ncbi:pseudouridine synthase [Tsukamurella sp. 8F]|uniref:pseudouridine synthase n=1 Tax=Tsukamurella sp. 8F TaxID=3031961 RepID=UPI0023BA080B|nr:pseudouridine synthase [Tsukamurella sp. 8F]MDF0589176.1 pseudouridine synthase [Tsukamurella sp. 8F]
MDPTRLVIAAEESGRALGDVLEARFPGTGTYLAAEFAAGSVVSADGAVLAAATPVADRMPVWLYRRLPEEVEVPFAVRVLYRDERIVVVDKPHYLATMPRGARVVQSVLVRLRRELDDPRLAPAHRLDRLTAGVLLFTVDPAVRGAYQQLFASGRARKEYEALAPVRSDLELPTVVRSRIAKTPGIMRAYEVDGEPNSESRIELVETLGGYGRYRLLPRTGKTHQLRMHMCGLGIPIIGDPLYPEQRRVDDADFSDPLRLLARRLAFTDPVDGTEREFVSLRALDPPQVPAVDAGTP